MINWPKEILVLGQIVVINTLYYIVTDISKSGQVSLREVEDGIPFMRVDIDYVYENATIAPEAAQVLYGHKREA